MKSAPAANGGGVSVSHPTRGAWIEIRLVYCALWPVGVAPHTGCVD